MMKKIKILAMWLCLLILLGACLFTDTEPPRMESWLCSINADGTGFRKIKIVGTNFGTTGFSYIYMTKDDKIVFYGDKLWISDTDVIEPVQMVPDTLSMDLHPRLSQSSTGDKLYFAANNSIYQLSYPDLALVRIAEVNGRKLLNPIVSIDDKTLAYLTFRQMKGTKDYSMTASYLSLDDNIVHELPELGQYCHNVAYRMTDGKLYYTRSGSLYQCSLTGENVQLIANYASDVSHIFGFSHDERYLILKSDILRVIDLHNNTLDELSVLEGLHYNQICTQVKTANVLYYVNPSSKLMKYDMDTHIESAVPFDYTKTSFDWSSLITSNCDGTTLYFTCYVSNEL